MKLEQLIMFQSVAELGSLREASKRLHKTQPAVSQGIKQLESILGVELFSRSGYRLVLTEHGKALYQHALRVLNEAKAMRNMAKHISSGNELSITLAIEASFDLRGILPLFSDAQRQFPDTQIILKQEHLSGAIQALNENRANLCLSPVTSEVRQNTQLEMHYLSSGCLINVASKLLLNRHPNLSLAAQLINEYQIVVQDSGTQSKNKRWGVQDGQRCWYVNDFATKKMLIESGMGWGRLPLHLVQESIDKGLLVELDLEDSDIRITFDFYLIKNKDTILGPVAQTLWDEFKTYTFNTASLSY
ncbi:LysR family transcriptional regulator [Alteromonas sp. KUL156]|nr:LysR family transcriptional regulator [Alteromonas sp. KUL154]GFD98129.1 LysR family transcriptional regulator [Alteromonas sp. KUL156]